MACIEKVILRLMFTSAALTFLSDIMTDTEFFCRHLRRSCLLGILHPKIWNLPSPNGVKSYSEL